MIPRLTLRAVLLIATPFLLAGCVSEPTPEPTPVPTTYPAAPPEAASTLAATYLDAWVAGDYAAMYAALDPVVQERYSLEQFSALHASLADLARVDEMSVDVGEPHLVAVAPERRPEAFPPPTPSPRPSPDPASTPNPSATAAPIPTPTPDPAQVLPGPVPGLAVPVELAVTSEHFGALDLERELTMVEGPNGWLVRWTPAVVFPELGEDGTLRLDRTLGVRGRVLGVDGSVWAENRDDGARIYPQEWLGGQVVGYVSEVTAEDLDTGLAERGYRAGDVVGRSGIEFGAEDLLRGEPGWTLVAVPGDGPESILFETPMVPGADVAITLRPTIQASAQQAMSGYGAAATAVVDPASGDVWALASQPAFNPNAMTIGATLAGDPLAPAGAGQVLNKALLGAYPAGSSFKPFTLIAALTTGVATPQTLVTCPSTWRYSADYLFRNYMNHSLPGLVGLAEAMAFSCNTTFMPLSYEVYLAQETALTDTLKEFGFGAATGIGYLVEETGIVPDDAWLAANGRGGYSAFEQIQLSIGQGAFLGTPLQLANAFAAIGNGGTLWQPRILVTATLPDGTVVESVEPTVAHDISATPEQLAFVTDTLQAVVTLPYGTGTAAFAGFGIPVAGKSGTAETGGPDPHAWFPAFAPADAPTISVATVLPTIPLGTGGADAAPLVRIVMATHFTN